MAARGRQPGFYVYRIFDGHETVYVGKGSGRRLSTQIKRFGLEGEIVEVCKDDDDAFRREIYWIGVLKPTSNIILGGNGGRCKPKLKPRLHPIFAEIARLGSRICTARGLLRKIDERNCAAFGVTSAQVALWREVAAGAAN